MATQSGLPAPTCTVPCTSATKQGPGDPSCCGVVGPGFPCGRGFQCPSIRGDTMVSHTQSFLLRERSEIHCRHLDTQVSVQEEEAGDVDTSGGEPSVVTASKPAMSRSPQAKPVEDHQSSAKSVQLFPYGVTKFSFCWKILGALHKAHASCQPPDPHQDLGKALRTPQSWHH